MNEKRAQQVREAAAPYLRAGEQVEVSVLTSVGRVSARRRVPTAAIVEATTGGLLILSLRPRKAYLAMTNQRLVFLGGRPMSGRPGPRLLTVNRSAARVARVREGVLTLKVDLAIARQEHALRIVFRKASRDEAEKVIFGLGSAGAA
jgi:hypothetical protein